jgi:hypothetical protein
MEESTNPTSTVEPATIDTRLQRIEVAIEIVTTLASVVSQLLAAHNATASDYNKVNLPAPLK